MIAVESSTNVVALALIGLVVPVLTLLTGFVISIRNGVRRTEASVNGHSTAQLAEITELRKEIARLNAGGVYTPKTSGDDRAETAPVTIVDGQVTVRPTYAGAHERQPIDPRAG